MKKWNTPEIAALDINMTESGSWWKKPEEVWCTFWGPYVDHGTPQQGQHDGGGQQRGNANTSTDGEVTDLTSGTLR